jgi:hypothetical protein
MRRRDSRVALGSLPRETGSTDKPSVSVKHALHVQVHGVSAGGDETEQKCTLVRSSSVHYVVWQRFISSSDLVINQLL